MIVKDYLRAGYPLIWITTQETDRIGKQIAEYYLHSPIGEVSLSDRGGVITKSPLFYSIFRWNIIEGLIEITQQGDGKSQQITDPMGLLQNIPSQPQPAIFLVENFHPYMKNPAITQAIKCLRDVCKNTQRHLIFLSPVLDFPIELEKEITVLDYSLPDKEELRQIIMHPPMGADFDTSNIPSSLVEKAVDALQGMTLFEAENAFALSLVKHNKVFSEQCLKNIIEEKRQIIRKSGVLEYYPNQSTLQDVGGLENLKSWLNTRSKAFTEEARQFGLPSPKGILLVGVPGTGKSLVAKSISQEWKMPLVRLDIGRIFGSMVGQSEQNIRSALKTIDALGECVVWIDEIEKGMSGMKSSGQTDSGVTSRVMGNILTWMQEKTASSFVVATANDVSALPAELLRKGRWDELFFVDLPSAVERMQIFWIHLQKRNRRAEDFRDIDACVKKTEGYTGAEIEQIVIGALYIAFNEARELSGDDILRSISQTIPLSQTMRESINTLREWAKDRARSASIEKDIPYQRRII